MESMQPCHIDGCDRPAKARQMCNAHYLRWWHHGDPLYVRPPRLCDCGEPAEARGLCHRHYQRWKYRRDPEKFKRWERERRAADPARVRAQENARYHAAPTTKRLGAKRRKARKKGALGSYTVAEWRALLASVEGRCVYCDAEATTADHVVPLSRGGTDYIDNIVPACAPCNISKGAKLLEEWLLPALALSVLADDRG